MRPPVPSFPNCLIPPLLPLISCFPHPWAQILPSVAPTFQCGARRFEAPSKRQSASLLLMKMTLNLPF